MSNNKWLNAIDIIKNKGYVGGSYLNKDLENFILGITSFKGNYIFDSEKQLKNIRKVSSLLRFLKLNNKKILFFGLNKKNYNSIHSSQIERINKEIFELSLGIRNKESNKLAESFYNKLYRLDGKVKLKELEIVRSFRDFDKKISKKKYPLNGYFFDSWEGSYLSNYHILKAHLNYQIKSSFFENDLRQNDKEQVKTFLNRFKTFFYLSKILDNDDLPGAAVFFSKEGYEDLFSELNRLGIPIICLVNSSESLKGIDYPLLGNTSYFDIIIFYQRLLNRILSL